MTRILNAPDVVERLDKLSFMPKPGSRAEFTAFIQAEIAKWGKAVKDSGAKAE
jgi:tripartite-type tricarboxylate transporter receptor subunit TctC